MPKMYTEPSDVATLVPRELATELRQTVEDGFRALGRIPQPLASQPLGVGKWTPKQVLGHLIDSAANNLQRFVRLQIEPALEFPGYQQEEWVAVQCYDVMPWMQTLETWRVINLHLSHVVAHMKTGCLGHEWLWNEGPVTLGYLVEDYIAHMKHHLRQMPVFAEVAQG